MLAPEDPTDDVGVVGRVTTGELLSDGGASPSTTGRSRRATRPRSRATARSTCQWWSIRRDRCRARSTPWWAVDPQRREHSLRDVGLATPISCRRTRPGLAMGRARLNTVGVADLSGVRAGKSKTRGGTWAPSRNRCRRLRCIQHPGGSSSMTTPKAFQDVGGTALHNATRRAVLADRDPGPGDNDGGHRRNVDRVASIAAGADDVDRPRPQLVTERNECRRVEHGVEQTRQLLAGLALRRADATTNPISCAGVASPERMVDIARGHRRRRDLGVRATASASAGHPPRSSKCDTSSDYGLRLRGVVRFAASAVDGSERALRVLRRTTTLPDDATTLTLGRATPHALLLAMQARVRGMRCARRIAGTRPLQLRRRLPHPGRTFLDRAPDRLPIPATQSVWVTRSPQSFCVSSGHVGIQRRRRRPHCGDPFNIGGAEINIQG